ncbi:carbohydrate ABC transporter membrane protein 1 (CUT1 family) [Comamonas sp. BIGb0124]|nr:carbohydrate ABC transporter membrane protein 1 (CUT1 family) [Comamonas sp. BIGb0124]
MLVAAAAFYLLCLVVGPMLYEFYLSLTDARLLNIYRNQFVGLANYAQMMADTRMLAALRITVVYTVLTVGLALAAGVASALAVHGRFPGRSVGRVVLILPWAMPSVAAALAFTWIFNQETGVLNRVVQTMGGTAHGWLTDPDWALAAVIAVSAWKTFPFVMLVVLAALQSIPEDLYEAARLDRADAPNTFAAVTWPHIAPAVGVVALLLTIWAFRRFEVIWLLTEGGPLEATNTLVVDVYRASFIQGEIGRGAALGVVGLVFSTLVTLVYFHVTRQRDSTHA